MSSSLKLSLVPIIISAAVRVYAQNPSPAYNPPKVTDCPNGSNGWCYWASNQDAPPLCNSQCTTAINRLCGEALDETLTSVEQDCQIEYMPPSWPFTRNGAHPSVPTAQQCTDNFNGILSQCGKDASSPVGGVNQSYCTPSGGGGTYGWYDDAAPLQGSARYVILAKGSDQRGQSKAPWQSGDQCVLWDDTWVKDTDQVVLVTDGPQLAAMTAPAALASLSAAIPPENPACDTHECDLKGQPYYADSPSYPWVDQGNNKLNRHRIVFEGWGIDAKGGSDALFEALHDRCQAWPDNWALYKNGTQNIADFGLPVNWKNAAAPGFFDPGDVKDLCWCIPYAIFDVSVGITLPISTFCPPNTPFPSTEEFHPARKRGLETNEPGLFKNVEKMIAKRAMMAKRNERDDISELVD